MVDGETLASDRIKEVCPSLTLDLQRYMDDPLLMELFVICDPSRQMVHEHSHHSAFERVYAIIKQLVA